jgi:hypothetical protein
VVRYTAGGGDGTRALFGTKQTEELLNTELEARSEEPELAEVADDADMAGDAGALDSGKSSMQSGEGSADKMGERDTALTALTRCCTPSAD